MAPDSPNLEIRAVPVPAGAASFLAFRGKGRLLGWSLRESTALALATVNLYNTSKASGLLIGTIPLVANEGVVQWFSGWGIPVNDIYLEIVSGSVVGCLYLDVFGAGPG